MSCEARAEKNRGDEKRKQHPFDELKPRWRILWRCLIALCVGLFLALASDKLLPEGEAVKRILAKGYLPWLTASNKSPLERYLPPVLVERTTYPDRKLQDQEILVLSIDDADLEAANLKWPPSLSLYAWLIGNLQKDGARAIFLDMLLIDPRPPDDVEALLKAACDAARAGIPVFLASIPGQVVTGSPETLLRKEQDVNGVMRPCIERVSPFTSEDVYDRATWEYPLCGRGLPSAALALACESRRAVPGKSPCIWQREFDQCRLSPSAQRPPNLEDTERQRDSQAKKMALVWPARGSAFNQKLLLETAPRSSGGENLPEYQHTCSTSLPPEKYVLPLALVMPQDLPDWVVALVPATVKQMLPEPKPKALCPYSDLLPMRALLGYGMKPDERKKLVKDRLVLIGANFVGHSDRHTAPLHEDMAGVQVHAMALDNLLTYGPDWRRVGEFAPLQWHRDPDTRPGTLYALVSVLLIVLAWELQEQFRERARQHEDPLRSPRSDWLFGRKPWLPCWLASVKNLLLTVFTLGRLPARRRGRLALLTLLGYLVLSLALWFGLIGLLFYLANDWFHVGPLSQVEYVLVPLALGFIDQGHRLARGAVLLWNSPASEHAAQRVRELRDVHEDEDWTHKRRQNAVTPRPADGVAEPVDTTPAPPPAANDARS